MPKSKIEKFEKNIINGNHYSKEYHGKVNYGFKVKMADGQEGNAMSQNPEGSWDLETEYDYEVQAVGNFTNLKIKKPFNKGGGYVWKYNAEEQHQSFKLTSVECALTLASKFNVDASSVVMKQIFDYIVKRIGDSPTKQDCMNVSGCIKRACDSVGKVRVNTTERKGEHINKIDEVFNLSDMYLQYVSSRKYN